VAERTFSESEHFRRPYREHQRFARGMGEASVADLKMPSPVSLRGPCRGESQQRWLVCDPDGISLHDNIESGGPLITACHQDHVLAVLQVHGLLLTGAGAEVERIVKPNSNQGADVWAAVSADGADPEQLRRLECLTRLRPWRRDRVGVAKTRVEFSIRRVRMSCLIWLDFDEHTVGPHSPMRHHAVVAISNVRVGKTRLPKAAQPVTRPAATLGR